MYRAKFVKPINETATTGNLERTYTATFSSEEQARRFGEIQGWALYRIITLDTYIGEFSSGDTFTVLAADFWEACKEAREVMQEHTEAVEVISLKLEK